MRKIILLISLAELSPNIFEIKLIDSSVMPFYNTFTEQEITFPPCCAVTVYFIALHYIL
jgi:hypothetical protein